MVEDVIWEINKLGTKARDCHLTGWINWPAKQDLYKIYWEVKKELDKCPTFADEDEWIREHEQDVFLEKLEGKL